MNEIKRRRVSDVHNRLVSTPPESHSFEVKLNAEGFFNNKDHSDVTLNVNDGELVFYVHKVILSTRSQFFCKMFTGENWKESRTSEVDLKIGEEDVHVFEDFLRFMYSGNIKLNKVTVWQHYFLADEYIVDDLMFACSTYVLQNLKVQKVKTPTASPYGSSGTRLALDPMTVFTTAEVADLFQVFHEEKVKKSAATNLLARLSDLSNELWQDFQSDLVCAVLSSDMSVLTENELFNLASDWLTHDQDTREGHAENVLSCIRYSHMAKAEELFEAQMNEFVVKSPKLVSCIAGGCHYKFMRGDLTGENFAKLPEFKKKQYQNRRYHKRTV